MGFGHSWRLKEELSPIVWAQLSADALALANALPGHLKDSEQRSRERVPPEELRSYEAFIKAANKALSFDGGPIQPRFPNGSFEGEAEGGGRAIAFGASARPGLFEVAFFNQAGEGWAKTGGRPHDLVLCALLCRVELLAPGTLKVESTDAEEGYFEESARWASKALGEELPIPRGINGSRAYNQAALARREAAQLSGQIGAALAPARKPGI